MHIKITFWVTTLLWLVGCTTQPVDIAGFDAIAFRADPGGCQGTRNQMKESIFANDSSFKGLSQEEVYATLGKPDRQDLATRSQKYYVYFIEPSPTCAPDATSSQPLTLLIRFSAINRATEISYENY